MAALCELDNTAIAPAAIEAGIAVHIGPLQSVELFCVEGGGHDQQRLRMPHCGSGFLT